MHRAGIAAVVAVLALAGAAMGQTRFDISAERARLAQDTGRIEEALKLFDEAESAAPGRAAELAPDRAWAYMRLGNLAIAAKDMKLADELFSRSFEIDPQFVESYSPQWVFARLTGINDAMSEASRQQRHSDWEALVEQVKWVLELAPDNLRAHFQLGLLYEYQNRGEDAKDEYATVIGGREGLANQSLESMREEARKAVYGMRFIMDLNTPVYPAWRKAEPGPWQVYRRGPFVIQHHNEALAKRIAAVLEYSLAQPVLGGVLTRNDPFPSECKVQVYPDENSYKRAGTQMWAGGQSKFMVLDGKLQSATIQLYQTATELLESAAPHELTHVRLVASAHFYEGLPLWLQEGMASTAESQVKRTATVRALVEARNADRMIPIEDLMKMTTYPEGQQAVDVYYGESLAVVEGLVARHGKERFWRFVAALEREDQTGALMTVYRLKPIEAENLVLEWIDSQK